MHDILESAFARIFLFLHVFRTNPSAETDIYINLHQFAQFAYIVLLFLSSLDNEFILIGYLNNSRRSKNRNIRAKVDS